MWFKKFFDKSMYRFLIVGLLNTIIGLALMFFLYNIIGLGYWGATAPAYIAGSVFSYFMNRSYTFSYKKRDKMSILRFAAVQIAAYIIAYFIAKPLVVYIFTRFNDLVDLDMNIIEQIAIVIGMCFFIVLGYTGQRFFVFKKNSD